VAYIIITHSDKTMLKNVVSSLIHMLIIIYVNNKVHFELKCHVDLLFYVSGSQPFSARGTPFVLKKLGGTPEFE